MLYSIAAPAVVPETENETDPFPEQVSLVALTDNEKSGSWAKTDVVQKHTNNNNALKFK